MKTLFLLVLLSQNGAGDINASFVNTETLEECRQRQRMVSALFTSARIPIKESLCVESELRFSRFNHEPSSNKKRHFYLIRFSDERVDIDTMPDWRSCMLGQKEAEGTGRIYCGSSIQSLKR